MTALVHVDYVQCARRHLHDAYILHAGGRRANAGQLFGFSVECGLKAVLVRAGASVDQEGSVTHASKLKKHLPVLGQQIAEITALPDGRLAGRILSQLGSLAAMNDWRVDHRYWRTSRIPLNASLAKWEMCALEMDDFLDTLIADGIL